MIPDDWKSEILPKLNNSQLYLQLKKKCNTKDNEVITLVDRIVSYSHQRTKTIIKHMGEFTLHDSDHLFRVLYIMELLLGEKNIKNLNSPELMLLIASALLHDIGMAPDEKEVLAIKKIWDSTPVFMDSIEEEYYTSFKRFYSTRTDQHEIIDQLVELGNFSQADTVKSYLMTDYIRLSHADRARNIIEQDWMDNIVFRDVNLTVELAQLCYSHNDDALALLDMDKNHLCGNSIVCCLPLLGVILRLADILDFDGKRTPQILFSHLYVRNPISLIEWNKHRAIEAWEITPDLIQYSATCNHPAIEASIHEFCNLIDNELSVCNNIISTLNDFNKNANRNINIKLPFKVNRDKIKTKRDIRNKPIYFYRETKFQLSKRQVIDLLMGTKLYGSPEVALRELLQNSIDACQLRNAQEKKWGNLYSPEVFVRYYTEGDNQILEIDDNGTGMDEYIIDNYYSKVGSSFYKSSDFYNLKAESNADFTPRSRFGIGILSCFMVADTLIVDTKRAYANHNSSEPLNLTVEGQESIFWIKSGKRKAPGTTTKLILRKVKNPWEMMDEEEFIKSVEAVIPNPPFAINIKTTSHAKTRNEHSFMLTTASALINHSWNERENVIQLKLQFQNKDTGIIGSAVVALVESHKMPAYSVEIKSKNIDIEGENYSLKRSIRLGVNNITQESTSITITDDEDIIEEKSNQIYNNSISKFSLHGIEVPMSLFRFSWEVKANEATLNLPFPIILVIDICGNRDLNLNSSRTQIIKTDKWVAFEEEISYLICSGIKKQVTKKYWSELKTLLLDRSRNEQFLRALNRVS